MNKNFIMGGKYHIFLMDISATCNALPSATASICIRSKNSSPVTRKWYSWYLRFYQQMPYWGEEYFDCYVKALGGGFSEACSGGILLNKDFAALMTFQFISWWCSVFFLLTVRLGNMLVKEFSVENNLVGDEGRSLFHYELAK